MAELKPEPPNAWPNLNGLSIMLFITLKLEIIPLLPTHWETLLRAWWSSWFSYNQQLILWISLTFCQTPSLTLKEAIGMNLKKRWMKFGFIFFCRRAYGMRTSVSGLSIKVWTWLVFCERDSRYHRNPLRAGQGSRDDMTTFYTSSLGESKYTHISNLNYWFNSLGFASITT